MPEADSLLTVTEVAEQLRVTGVTVRAWIRSGRLAAIRVGGRGYRVRRSDLEQMVAMNQPSPGPEPSGPVAFEDISLFSHVRLPDDG